MTPGGGDGGGDDAPTAAIPPDALAAFSALVRWRRDVRRFKPISIDPERIEKLLRLADRSPSVGNSQPWRIVRVDDPDRRTAIRENFASANADAAAAYAKGAERDHYLSLKLAGLDTAPVHVAIFCQPDAEQGRGLGRQTMPEMLAYSCVCMITTLWYAARADGLGMGWLSIINADRAAKIIEVPEDWQLIAYLLIGVAEEEHTDAELERHGWQARTDFATRFVHR